MQGARITPEHLPGSEANIQGHTKSTSFGYLVRIDQRARQNSEQYSHPVHRQGTCMLDFEQNTRRPVKSHSLRVRLTHFGVVSLIKVRNLSTIYVGAQ